MFLIKFLLSFTVSFLILCFPLGRSTLFDHAYKVVSPITNNVFTIIKSKAIEGYEESRDFTRQFFSNSKPREDKVHKISSSTQKGSSPSEHNEEEGYTVEERELLKKILTSEK